MQLSPLSNSPLFIPELLEEILSYVATENLPHTHLVCRFWSSVTESKKVWVSNMKQNSPSFLKNRVKKVSANCPDQSWVLEAFKTNKMLHAQFWVFGLVPNLNQFVGSLRSEGIDMPYNENFHLVDIVDGEEFYNPTHSWINTHDARRLFNYAIPQYFPESLVRDAITRGAVEVHIPFTVFGATTEVVMKKVCIQFYAQATSYIQQMILQSLYLPTFSLKLNDVSRIQKYYFNYFKKRPSAKEIN